MDEKKTIRQWVKEHKQELIAAGFIIVGTIIVIWKKEDIVAYFKKNAMHTEEIPDIPEDMGIALKPMFPKGFLDSLTGNKMTARELGDKAYCSAQAINKRLVAEGLIERLPCGEYLLTEKGQKVGEWTSKTTAAGYSFSNIEWDEKVLDIIFNPEELEAIDEWRKKSQDILTRPAIV